VMSFDNILIFSATMWSHRELQIWVCCCKKGEANDKGFKMSGVVFLGEKYKCQQNLQNISTHSTLDKMTDQNSEQRSQGR
jgi:hypothetical protein